MKLFLTVFIVYVLPHSLPSNGLHLAVPQPWVANLVHTSEYFLKTVIVKIQNYSKEDHVYFLGRINLRFM